MSRILVINPALLRLNTLGACEQDRLTNLQRLRRLGHDVHLLTGWMPYQARAEVEAWYAQAGIPVTLAAIGGGRLHPRRLTHLALLDGMAWEYAAPGFAQAVEGALAAFKPDLVWCHGSYLWGPALQARRRGIPAVIRSVNYEAEQLLHERGRSLPNRLRYQAKAAGERRSVRGASALAAITPDEQALYQRLAPQAAVHLLPLQTLPALLRPARPVRTAAPLHVFFMGATYNVEPNREALRFVVERIAPRSRAAAPGAFVFHILGGKAPAGLQGQAADDLIFHGYVPDLETFLAEMDIALMPSLQGVGMQQKIFESLCRAYPTVTHRRALAGYAYTDGEAVLLADDEEAFVRHLLALRDPALRERLSAGAAAQSARLFSEAALEARVREILSAAAG